MDFRSRRYVNVCYGYVMGSRPAAILSCRTLRKLLSRIRVSSGWQKKGAGHTASLPWLFWGLVLRVARRECKAELLIVSLTQSKQENILFWLDKHKARREHRKQHENDFVSPTYHHRKHSNWSGNSIQPLVTQILLWPTSAGLPQDLLFVLDKV